MWKYRFKGVGPGAAVLCAAIIGGAFLFQKHFMEKSAGADGPAEPRSEAERAMAFLDRQRTHPAQNMPPGGFYRAHEHSQNMAKRSGELKSPDEWESIGPTNQGGRTLSLAVDPNNPDIVYAGAASGGLWRMTQSGSNYSWEYLETGFPVLGVGAVALDPLDSRVIYIGTGEVYQYGNATGGLNNRSTRGSYGIGVLKSVDSGVTWEMSLDWAYNLERGVQSLRIHPENTDVVLAGTTEGVYRSLDGGGTWERVLDVLMAVDLAINPENPDVMFASCGNQGTDGAGIYRSLSGGAPGSWEELGGGLPGSWGGKALMSMYEADPDIIYVDIGDRSRTVGLYRTDDGGETWTEVNNSDWASYQGWFAHYVRVHPTNSNRLLVAGVNFYSSTDGGRTLNSVSGMHVDHHAFANDPSNPDVVYFANDGGVYKSTNAGATFSNRNRGYVTTQFYNGFASSPLDPDLATGGLQDNDCIMYVGEADWRRISCRGDGTFTAINPLNDNTMYASSQNLNLHRSRNRGQSWTSLANGMPQGRTAFISPFVLAPSRPNILYGGKSYLYRTENEGDNWEIMNGGDELDGNPIISLAVSPLDPDIVFAATNPSGGGQRSRLYASMDGGENMTEITGDLPDRFYVDIKASHHNPDVVYVTASGFGASHLFRSEDMGANWQDVGEGLPDVPTSAVALDPADSNIIYLGNDLGVYVSTDYGARWYYWKHGMPTASLVMDLSLSISDRRIRAVTHGNGVYERSLLPPGTLTGVEETSLPAGLKLESVSGGVRFSLPKAGNITLEIVDVRGKIVRRLARGEYAKGIHRIQWDGRQHGGSSASRGMYVYRLRTAKEQSTRSFYWAGG